jgi:peptidoglycan lytic transglycosylase F
MQRLKAYTSTSFLIVSVLACLCLGCSPKDSSYSISQQGTLRIITRNGPTTYYEDRTGPAGFEYELAKLFATYLNVEMKVTAVHSLEEVFQALKNNTADLAAAGLTITEKRQQSLYFSPSYLPIKQYVLYRNDRSRPRSTTDILNARITVLAHSSHHGILSTLATDYPELNWHSATDVETIDTLEMLNDGEIDFTLIDSNEYLANRAFYPRLHIGFEIGEPGELAWALDINDNNTELRIALQQFFQQINEDGTLRQLQERFYSHSEQVNQSGSLTFSQAVKKRLPRYRDLIQQVATESGVDWRLLAAISYQESHWNPKARSPTGVRGMMMLTLPTAKEMGIKNRLDAEQSLRGGARYFNKIIRRIPERIKDPDRTWFALAAYNVGLGHLEDARKITENQGANPDTWADVKTHLPLLRKRRWYKNTKYGYARGNEPVGYVQNIRHFYNVLNWNELSKNRTPPPQKVDQYLPEVLQDNSNTF